MKRNVLPEPPSPDGMGALAWQRAMYRWAQRVKRLYDDALTVNAAPAATPFVVGTYAVTTYVDGTSTNVADYLSTLTAALTDKGILSPSARRSS